MLTLASHSGSWTGSNGFRLMPDDPLHEGPGTALVSTASAGHLVAIAYTWAHPHDGEQDGLLVIGPGEAEGGVVAFWGDSWHQAPSPRVLTGSMDGGTIVVDYEYGDDWMWLISVDITDPEALGLRMDNVIPASAATDALAAGPYPAMVARLIRA